MTTTIYKYHITLFLIFIWNISYGQQYVAYNTDNGLPSNHIYRITQDNFGFIWILTDKGMVKFNGNEFKTFTTKNGLPTNDVWDIRNTPDNKVWYFSKSPKLGYILNDSVYAFASAIKDDILHPVSFGQNNNSIVFSSANNTYELQNNKWQVVKSSSVFNTEKIISKKIGHLIVKIDSTFILDKNNTIISSFETPKEYKTIHYSTQINDSLFFLINTKGYSIINFNTLKLTSKTFKNQLSIGIIEYVRISLVNNQIQISGQDFVSILDDNYDLKGTVFIPKKFKSHFSFIDKDRNLWIATFNKGVYFLPYMQRNLRNDLVNDEVGKLQWVNKKLIANVYNKGFYKYNETTKKFEPYILIQDFLYNACYIDSIQTEFYLSNLNLIRLKKGITKKMKFPDDSNENLNSFAKKIILYNNSLFSFNSSGLNKLDFNLNVLKSYRQNGIKDLIIFNAKLFVATAKGLMLLENDSLKNAFKAKKQIGKPVTHLVTMDDDLIVCTDGFGAYHTDLKTVRLLEKSDFLSVTSAFVKNNEIWLSTNEGILQYKKTKDKYKLIQKYTKRDGLSSDLTNGIFVIGDDLIISSNNGISIISRNQTRSNSSEIFYYDKIQYNNFLLKNNSTIEYTNNSFINITVSSIEFCKNKTHNYEYKLYPIQKEWTQTASKQLSFFDLQPIKYTLQIRSIKKSNLSSLNQISSFSFEIKPLWWQKKIYRLFTGLCLLLILAYILWQVNNKQKKKQERKMIQDKLLLKIELKALRTQMNPHFVFNSLAAIQYYIINNNYEASEKFLVKFSVLIRQFFELSKEDEITIETEISLLRNYLDLETLRFKEKLNYTINIDRNLDTKNSRIPTMLLQPITENAVNHGIFNKVGKGILCINFLYIDKLTFRVEIIDDGVGFLKTKKEKTGKVKSTSILEDRLYFLNLSKKWSIQYSTEELNPNSEDKGNKAIFIITNLNK